MEHTKKKPRPLLRGWQVALLDVLALGLALVVFSLFHHVLPRRGAAKLQIVSVPAQPTAAVTAAATHAPALAPAPTPTPKPGDFSAAFPQGSTGEGALHSYQGDGLRIAIDRVQEDGVTYFVADVWVKDISRFQTAFAKGQFGQGYQERPKKIAEDQGAVFAITGDYYGARAKGVVIRNGVLYRDTPFRDVCVLYADGVMETYAKEEFDLEAAIAREAYQAWSFGPRLLLDGRPIEEFSDSIKRANPRAALGYYEPGHYCFLVADGRQPKYSKGMTLAELSAAFYALGCKEAYNLDGGQTAAMLFEGELVNQPYQGGRRVSDIIYFGGEG